VEHDEMARYGTAPAYAELLGYDEAAGCCLRISKRRVWKKESGRGKAASETLSGLAEGNQRRRAGDGREDS
jgi:ferritin-like metal-binding protein YciE